MATREDARRYRRELSELENVAGDPVIPGEVAGWCDAVGAAIETVRKTRAQVLQLHESAFGAILETNLEMGGPVEQLQAGDRESTKELARIAAGLAGAREVAGRRGTSEEPVDDVTQLREDLIAWIGHARAHEKEVDHWLIEASLRDTGFAD